MKPNTFCAYTVVLLRHNGRFLLLQRSAAKAFAPQRWTGLGGRVEPAEFTDLARHPAGIEPIRLGLAIFHPDGQLERQLWQE
jgi:8-oxo-dGTP diphosphatase